MCCVCGRKDPREEKTINNLSSIKFKAAANSRGLYIVNYMNFPITMLYQRAIKVHSSKTASASLVLSVNATVTGLEILEDKSDAQTLMVSRSCGPKH